MVNYTFQICILFPPNSNQKIKANQIPLIEETNSGNIFLVFGSWKTLNKGFTMRSGKRITVYFESKSIIISYFKVC